MTTYPPDHDTGETPIDWLASHLTDDGDTSTIDPTSLRCIRQAIAGLMELDELRSIAAEHARVILERGNTIDSLLSHIYDIRLAIGDPEGRIPLAELADAVAARSARRRETR